MQKSRDIKSANNLTSIIATQPLGPVYNGKYTLTPQKFLQNFFLIDSGWSTEKRAQNSEGP